MFENDAVCKGVLQGLRMQLFVHAWYFGFDFADFCARDVHTGLSCATFSTIRICAKILWFYK